MQNPPALLGVDVGGTFTDAVVCVGGLIHTAKAPTTPEDQSAGVMSAIESALERAGLAPSEIGTFAHGMTVATNALLEERGARTALIATRGFADVLEIARQNRPSLYHLCEPKPRPLVPAELRFEASERIGAEGVVEELSAGEVDRLVSEVGSSGADAVAICLLFSYAEPEHELALAEALRAGLPEIHLSASHEVLPRFREYERTSTTVIDAYLSPLLGRYLGRLAGVAGERGLPAPAVMSSSGGLMGIERAAGAGAASVLSGPAGGAIGASLVARLSGDGNAVGLDMGGTSCDVCVVEAGAVRRVASREIEGRTIQLPMIDVHTVGAGGGSVAWRDRGGALRVGPRSAGAEPGPACYGRGGAEPTVTDANLLLGYLPTGGDLAGGVSLDRDAAERAVGELASELEIDPHEAAAGIVRIANVEMTRALRTMTVERGVDPREFALLAFGGAGPLHAAAIAEELGMSRILCPRASGVLSALGLAAADRRHDTARTVMLRGDELTEERIAEEVEALLETLESGERTSVEASYELRYEGQAFELAVDGDASPDPEALSAGFEEAHERHYGYRDPDSDVELVTIRLATVEAGAELVPRASDHGSPRVSERDAWLGGRWEKAEVVSGEPAAGDELSGPCVVELPETTLVLPPGWSGRMDEHGTIVAERDAEEGR